MPADQCGYVAYICGVIAVGLGALMILGWALEISIATNFDPAYEPTPLGLALGVLLLGGALILVVQPGSDQQRSNLAAAAAAAVLAAVLGLGCLIGLYVWGRVPMALLLVSDPQSKGLAPAFLSSPLACGSLFLSGTAMAILSIGPARRWKPLVPLLALAVGFVNSVVVMGHVYGAPVLYGANVRSVGFALAGAFLALAVGQFAAAGTDCFPLRSLVGPSIRARLLRTFVPVTFLVVLLHAMLSDRLCRSSGINSATEDALHALASAALVGLVVLQMARSLGTSIGRAEEMLVRNLTEQRRLEHEILGVGAREQQRIGQDLHDDVGQLLTGLAYRLHVLEETLAETAPTEVREAAEIGQIALQAVNQMKQLVRGFFPVDLQTRGLGAAIADLAANMGQLYGIRCHFVGDQSIRFIDPETGQHLYRLTQEALSNAIKHGQPRTVTVQLTQAAGRVELIVTDDGIGFLPGGAPSRPGLGLRVMEFRANLIGATLDIHSNPGSGTSVKCTLPEAARG